jgi:6-phosphogluconolactonase/glucosamine-6-phosphate isomerase/deaminase
MILKVISGGNKKEQYPAGLIRPVRGSLLWLIDKEAARKLPKQTGT